VSEHLREPRPHAPQVEPISCHGVLMDFPLTRRTNHAASRVRLEGDAMLLTDIKLSHLVWFTSDQWHSYTCKWKILSAFSDLRHIQIDTRSFAFLQVGMMLRSQLG
jgi:hypothetical protein